MKILVIGGTHGNEPLGIKLVKLLQKYPIDNVDTLLANTDAIAYNVRFTGADLNRSFPGNVAGETYEVRRAAEILKACEGYDIVLDFHNTHCPENDCVFVGEGANPLLYDFASYSGLKKVIVADYDCLNKYAPNCVSVEISLDSSRMDVKQWLAMLREVAATSTIQPADDLELYRFVYRMSLEDRDRYGLKDADLRAFTAMESSIVKSLGLKNPAYPIFIGDAYTPYNYGGILNKINV